MPTFSVSVLAVGSRSTPLLAVPPSSRTWNPTVQLPFAFDANLKFPAFRSASVITLFTATATQADPFQRRSCWFVPVVLVPQDMEVTFTSAKLFGAGASLASAKPRSANVTLRHVFVADTAAVRSVPVGALLRLAPMTIVDRAVLLLSPVSSRTWTETTRSVVRMLPLVVFLNCTSLRAASYCARVAVPLRVSVYVPAPLVIVLVTPTGNEEESTSWSPALALVIVIVAPEIWSPGEVVFGSVSRICVDAIATADPVPSLCV